jgi:hypothetical protein
LLVLLGVGLGSWAFWLEPASLYNEDHTLRLPRWPRECDGLRVAVLADTHTGSPHNGIEKLEEVVRLIRAARPDVVLLAGDYVIHGVLGGDFVSPERSAEVLARLDAPLGVHAVLGNHDYWLGAASVRRALEAVGIAVYDDASVRLSKGSCRFWLTGIDDLWEGEPDIEAALASVPDGAPSLAFTHNPDLFPEVPDRVALTIAGHTHGGQVHLPWLGRPVVPSRFGERFASGHVVEAGRHLFVSTGVGTSILPVRFRVPPEVSVLTLRSAAGSAIARPTDSPRTPPSAKRG